MSLIIIVICVFRFAFVIVFVCCWLFASLCQCVCVFVCARTGACDGRADVACDSRELSTRDCLAMPDVIFFADYDRMVIFAHMCKTGSLEPSHVVNLHESCTCIFIYIYMLCYPVTVLYHSTWYALHEVLTVLF